MEETNFNEIMTEDILPYYKQMYSIDKFDMETVVWIEGLLLGWQKDYANASQKSKDTMNLTYGFIYGECVRQELNAEWVYLEEEPYQTQIKIVRNKRTIFFNVMRRVEKFWVNGKTDSLVAALNVARVLE